MGVQPRCSRDRANSILACIPRQHGACLTASPGSLPDSARSTAPLTYWGGPAAAEIYPRSRQMELPFSSIENRFRHTADASRDPIPAVEAAPSQTDC
jgi:hypothetical protein